MEHTEGVKRENCFYIYRPGIEHLMKITGTITELPLISVWRNFKLYCIVTLRSTASFSPDKNSATCWWIAL
jgi:hypothetical protein